MSVSNQVHKAVRPFKDKGLDHFVNTFQRIQTIPMSWDKKQQTFVTIRDHKKLARWYFAMEIVAFGICCCFYICLKELLMTQTTIPYWLTGMYTVIGAIGTGVFCGNVLIWIFTQDIVSCWNEFKELRDKVQTGS